MTGNPSDTVVFDLLHDKDPVIRTGAVRILGLAASPDAIDRARRGDCKDSDQDVRRAAIVALGAIKDPRTVAPADRGARRIPIGTRAPRRPTRSARSTTASR